MKLFVALLIVASASACTYQDLSYKNGDEWTQNNNFVMKCVIESNGSWRIIVTACVAQDGSKVPVNSTVLSKSGKEEWACTEGPPGSITLRSSTPERLDCQDGHKYGETWVERAFKFTCISKGRTQLVECITPQGNVPANATRDFNGVTMACNQFANGTITIAPVKPADGQCRDGSGSLHRNGEMWTEKNHFQKRCNDGKTTVLGCKVDELPEMVPLNSRVVKDRISYHCEGDNGNYKFFSKNTEE